MLEILPIAIPFVRLKILVPTLTLPVASSGNITTTVAFSPTVISSGTTVISIVTFCLGSDAKTVRLKESIAILYFLSP